MNRLVYEESALNDNIGVDYNAYQQRPETKRPEEPQGFTQECGEKQDVEQVNQATREAACAVFRDAIFAWVVFHLNLGDTKASPVSHNGYEAVKLAVELHIGVINDFTIVCLEAIVDVVQVYSCHLAYEPVENARRKRFGERIEARKFPTRDEIVAFIQLRKKVRNFCWIVLQISIHCEDNFTTTLAETSDERGRF